MTNEQPKKKVKYLEEGRKKIKLAVLSMREKDKLDLLEGLPEHWEHEEGESELQDRIRSEHNCLLFDIKKLINRIYD